MSLEDEKRRLRERLLAERARLPEARRASLSAAVADRLEGLPAWAAARTVALYAPMGAEVDTDAIARRAAAAGKRIAWPRLAPMARALQFAACAPGELVAGPLSTRQPPAGAPSVSADEIDLVVVPGWPSTPAAAASGGGAATTTRRSRRCRAPPRASVSPSRSRSSPPSRPGRPTPRWTRS
jgi:5-formyltetrahydrofolate cyclo-ligase